MENAIRNLASSACRCARIRKRHPTLYAPHTACVAASAVTRLIDDSRAATHHPVYFTQCPRFGHLALWMAGQSTRQCELGKPRSSNSRRSSDQDSRWLRTCSAAAPGCGAMPLREHGRKSRDLIALSRCLLCSLRDVAAIGADQCAAVNNRRRAEPRAICSLQQPARVRPRILHEVAARAKRRRASPQVVAPAAVAIDGASAAAELSLHFDPMGNISAADPARSACYSSPRRHADALAQLPIALHAPPARACNARIDIEAEERAAAEDSASAAARV